MHRDQLAFHQFVGAIAANGGGDGPEDIMGALKVTLTTLSWRPGVDKVDLWFLIPMRIMYD